MLGAGEYRLIDQPLQIILSNDVLSLAYGCAFGPPFQANVNIQPLAKEVRFNSLGNTWIQLVGVATSD